jgi:hypothetical protein
MSLGTCHLPDIPRICTRADHNRICLSTSRYPEGIVVEGTEHSSTLAPPAGRGDTDEVFSNSSPNPLLRNPPHPSVSTPPIIPSPQARYRPLPLHIPIRLALLLLQQRRPRPPLHPRIITSSAPAAARTLQTRLSPSLLRLLRLLLHILFHQHHRHRVHKNPSSAWA